MGAFLKQKPKEEPKLEYDIEEEEEYEPKENELKIDLYPKNIPRYTFDKTSVSRLITEDVIGHSLNPNHSLAYIGSNVPLLNGFYTAHTNHYPIRIKPDDIWLLIVQAFSNNFDGKQKLTVNYAISNIKQVDKKMFENFSEQINEQMKKFLGEKLIDILTPNFSTSDYNSKIVCKISIMGAFKKYFDYEMGLSGCGIPYIILEGTAQDYKDIIAKAKELKQYEFDWYIDKIIPHLEKMVEAKEGNIDIDYFKNMVQKKEVTEIKSGLSGRGRYEVKVDYISGWILNFFAYLNIKDLSGEISRFTADSMSVEKFGDFASQMLIVPFTIADNVHNKTYDLKYKVGFVGCEQNKMKQVFPIQGWIVSPSTQEDRDSTL